jgi:hypothetical protein
MLLLLRPLISMGFENKSSQGTIYAYVWVNFLSCHAWLQNLNRLTKAENKLISMVRLIGFSLTVRLTYVACKEVVALPRLVGNLWQCQPRLPHPISWRTPKDMTVGLGAPPLVDLYMWGAIMFLRRALAWLFETPWCQMSLSPMTTSS